MFDDFIIGNYSALIGCICLLVFILTNHLLDNRNTKLFVVAIFSIIILIVVDTLELFAASWAHPTQFRVLMSAIGYSLRPTIAYIIICILESRANLIKRTLSVLLIIDIICSFSALFCPIMFSYSTDNQFIRGPLGGIPFIISAVFLCGMLILTIMKYHEGYFEESLIALFVAVISVISIVGETCYHYKGLLNSSCTIAVVFYYLFFLTQQLKRDQLTKLRNRYCFYLDEEKRKGREFALIFIDINDLKIINDTKGHAAGDKLICDVVACIRRNIPAKAHAYRMGGDEFVILERFCQIEKINAIVKAIRDDVQATGNSCAIGVAFCPPDGDLDEVLKEADRAMYEDKCRIKQKIAEDKAVSKMTENL